MKIMLASDLHGSAYYTRLLLNKFEEQNADLLVLLGDIYNHGPRNPLPQEYAPMQVAEMLNAVKDKLLVIQGNCDSAVDTCISQFHFVPMAVLLCDGKRIYCTHGDVYNEDALPAIAAGDTLIYGHFHTVMCHTRQGINILNPGSISLPKDGNRAYCIIQSGVAGIIDLQDTVLAQLSL